MGSAKQDAKRAEVALRRSKLLELRRAGLTLAQCAEKLGLYDKAHAHNELRAALKAIVQPEAEEYRKLAEMRFDHMRLALSKKINAGDVAAIRAAVDVEDKQAKIVGYIAPHDQRLTVSTISPEAAAWLSACAPGSDEEEGE